MTSINTGSSPQFCRFTGSHTGVAAAKRIDSFFGHSVEMLEQLRLQNSTQSNKGALEGIYQQAKQSLQSLCQKLKQDHTANAVLTKKQIKNLTADLKKVEKVITSVVQETQILALATIGSNGNEDTKKKIIILARGGWKALAIRIGALFFNSCRLATEGFKAAQDQMKQNSRLAFKRPLQNESAISQEKRREWEAWGNNNKAAWSRRAGVIGVNDEYRFEYSLSPNKITKQFRSFMVQKISEGERSKIEKEFEVSHEQEKAKLVNRLTPLNQEYDNQLGIKSTKQSTEHVETFGKIFGKLGGISSSNRQEPHLVNGWESSLKWKGQPLFRALRHGIASDKHEPDAKIRAKNSYNAALELLKAAVLQEIADRGLSLEEAKHRHLILHFNSVSLVTPDDLRPWLNKHANERKMMYDQLKAFEELQKLKHIDIDGYQIPVQLEINQFNFGVNAGAVDWGLGSSNQHEQNKKACAGLMNEVQLFKVLHGSNLQQADLGQLDALQQDIMLLMEHKSSYLHGDNPYELGAKILCLTNLMDRWARQNPKGSSVGHKCAWNCMSGKDRTGIMDSIAKALLVLKEVNGKIPTHEELRTNASVRRQFSEIVVPLLLEGGSLEITELNTGALGYKVSRHALVSGMDEQYFLDMIGLSKTVSS